MWWLLACTDEPTDGDATPTEAEAPADPDVDSFSPASFPPVDPTRIVFFGDSITAGYGIENPDGTYPSLLLANQDAKYPDYVGNDLAGRYPGLVDVLDVSVGGATTDSVLASQLPRIEATWGSRVAGPTLVVGTIGGNDLLDVAFSPGDDAVAVERILDNLEQITAFFRDEARFPDGAYLAITNVYEPSDGEGQVSECFYGLDLSGFIPQFEALNEGSRGLAERDGWAWVDLRAHFVGHGFHHDDPGEWYDEADPTLWFQDDCIHPNVRGHHEVRRLFLSALAGEPLPLEVPAD